MRHNGWIRFFFYFCLLHVDTVRGAASDAPSFAICLNGQVLRLELASKINSLFVPNLQAGYRLDVFLHLDGNVSGVKRTAFSKLEVKTYTDCSEQELQALVLNSTLSALAKVGLGNYVAGHFRVFASFATTADHVFEIIGNKSVLPIGGDFGGAVRFQRNFAMLSLLRTCMLTLADREVRDRRFYDFVIRLRDDSLVYAPWVLRPDVYAHNLMDVGVGYDGVGGFGGVNDHTMVVDRLHADHMFRSPLEDYYLASPESGTDQPRVLRNTEILLFDTAKRKGVPIKLVSLCEMPTVPIGSHQSLFWVVDSFYADLYTKEIAAKPDVYQACHPRDWLEPRHFYMHWPDGPKQGMPESHTAHRKVVCSGRHGQG